VSRIALALLVVAATARAAFAHQTSIKYVELVIDGERAAVAFKVAPGDVTEPMHLPADAKPSAQAAAAAAGVPAYVATWLRIRIPTAAGSLACGAGEARAHADADGFVVVEWEATCPRPIDLVTLDFTVFFALDKRMEAIVRLGTAGSDEVTPTVVRSADSPITLRAGETSLPRWVRYGMNHIYTGPDHISFVLALLLVVMLERSSGWRVKRILPSLRATAGVITAFTVAHSITLISAALGVVTLPSRLVESIIAASIAYTAAEDVVRPDPRWRFALTFGFGLAHGLGFAATLAVDLPPNGVVPPLLCFNVGVELAQLSIVAIALPIFYLVARAIGAQRYRRVAMPAFASVIFAFGTAWFIQRAFDM
jgi:HupE/UreJ protein